MSEEKGKPISKQCNAKSDINPRRKRMKNNIKAIYLIVQIILACVLFPILRTDDQLLNLWLALFISMKIIFWYAFLSNMMRDENK